MNKMCCGRYTRIDRRQFIKLMAATSGWAILPPAFSYAAPKAIGYGAEAPVALAGVQQGAEDPFVAEAVKNAAREATDFSWLSRGDSVLIKPALNSGNLYPATTSPVGIGAMIELLREKGAGRVIVCDMSGIEHLKLTPDKLKGSTRDLMTASGMARVVLEAGGELHFPEEAGWDGFFADGLAGSSHWKDGLMMPKILREVDHLVLMPRCSRHALLGSSLGMKNAVGYWRTDTRLEYHRDAATIHEKTAEANRLPCLFNKQRLVLTTATKVLTTFGPDDGFVAAPATGLVIASESIVAHDMVSLAWLLENRAMMSDSERESARDPYKGQFRVNLINHVIVSYLGGVVEASQAQKLVRHDIRTIWDDRVLNRAYEVFGGIPRVKLLNAGQSIPEATKSSLLDAISKPI
ncbi:MAG: DUF362 domain-containing protein [Desulfobacterales bacterium]